jgi:hypothetical protein
MSIRTPGAGPLSGAGPLPIRERRRLHPTRASQLAVLAAAAVLPATQRERYTREFFAELHDVGRSRQLRHALGLLAHAWSLRVALHDTSPRPSGALTMRKSLRCTVHLHHYVVRRNGEVQPPDRYEQCTRCARVRDLPAIWVAGSGPG